jgi:tripartite-type tricarboxylate transporter receptor subunit TctC
LNVCSRSRPRRPHIFNNVGYDPRTDFSPLGLIASAPALLLAHRDLPAHTVGELIALMKAAKEPYQVATPGAGTVNYLVHAAGLE